MLLKKRFLSSPFAFGKTLSHYLVARRPGVACRDDDYDDIFGEGQADEEEGLWEQDEAERLRESKGSDPLSRRRARAARAARRLGPELREPRPTPGSTR